MTCWKDRRCGSREFYRMVHDILRSDIMTGAMSYEHHGRANSVYTHCVRTAWCSYRLCGIFHVSPEHTRSAVRAAMLHDLFGYDWSRCPASRKWLLNGERLRHAYRHGTEACGEVGKAFLLTPRQADAIRKHMFPTYPVPPVYVDGWVLTLADKVTAIEELFLDLRRRFGSDAPAPMVLREGFFR